MEDISEIDISFDSDSSNNDEQNALNDLINSISSIQNMELRTQLESQISTLRKNIQKKKDS
jgi:hypothetical protein